MREIVTNQFPPKPKVSPGKKILITLGSVIAALLLIGVIAVATNPESGNTSSAPTTVTVTATVAVPGPASTTVTAPAPPPVTVTFTPPRPVGFPEGIYQVGTQIAPGRYVTEGGSSCYYARLKNDLGDLDSIKSNNNLSGPGSVTIDKSDKFFEVKGDCEFTRAP